MIQITRLSKKYGKNQALEDLNLSIDAGQVLGVIGPNGAGKTTTFRILATLLKPTSGEASIDGHNVLKHPFEIKRIVGYMPDSFGVYDGMRLKEYLDFFGAAYKIPVIKRRSIIADVLELTDMAHKADEYVSAFSRGMKQRCCLAKTLIHDPKVLILDEPASGLDPRARIEIREVIKTLRGMGKTILISSHILSELADMCDRLAIIEAGKLIASGEVDGFRNGSDPTRTIVLDAIDGDGKAENFLNERPGVSDVARDESRIVFRSTLGDEEQAALLADMIKAGIKITNFRREEKTLEEVFMQLTKGKIGS